MTSRLMELAVKQLEHLLKEAGANRILFITMGKFGSEYYKYNYDISGEVYGSYNFNQIGEPEQIGYQGNFNRYAEHDIRQALSDLL